MPAIGEPECQMPSSRWPRVRMMTGAFCPPAVRQRSVARSSDMICSRVQEVVEVLDLGDGTQAAQRRADGLADDRALADAGVHDARDAVLFLQAEAALVDVAELADVFAEDDHARIAAQGVIEAVVEDLEAVQHRRVVGVLGLHFRHFQRGRRRFRCRDARRSARRLRCWRSREPFGGAASSPRASTISAEATARTASRRNGA